MKIQKIGKLTYWVYIWVDLLTKNVILLVKTGLFGVFDTPFLNTFFGPFFVFFCKMAHFRVYSGALNRELKIGENRHF